MTPHLLKGHGLSWLYKQAVWFCKPSCDCLVLGNSMMQQQQGAPPLCDHTRLLRVSARAVDVKVRCMFACHKKTKAFVQGMQTTCPNASYYHHRLLDLTASIHNKDFAVELRSTSGTDCSVASLGMQQELLA